MSASVREQWARQIEWGEGAQWMGIAHAAHPESARRFVAEVLADGTGRGKAVTALAGPDAETVLEVLGACEPRGCDLLIVHAAALDDDGQREVITALNRGRERVRRAARDGVVVVIGDAHSTSVRDLAPDLRSACAMRMDIETYLEEEKDT